MRWPVPNKKPPNETIRRRLTDSRFLDHYIDLSSANGFAKTNRPAARPCVIARMPRVCAVSANVAGVSRYHQSDSQPRHRPHKIVPSHLTFSSPPADSINMTTSHAAALIVLFTAWISAPFVQAQSQGDDAPPAIVNPYYEHPQWKIWNDREQDPLPGRMYYKRPLAPQIKGSKELMKGVPVPRLCG